MRSFQIQNEKSLQILLNSYQIQDEFFSNPNKVISNSGLEELSNTHKVISNSERK